MTLHVRTARLGSYQGPDAFDITRKSGKGDGLLFAPSWAILNPTLKAVRDGQELTKLAMDPHNDLWGRWLQSQAWGRYWAAYWREMRASRRAHRAAWDRLLARESVTLLCYCTEPSKCHRMILGAAILPGLGAVFEGERFNGESP